MSNPFSFPLLLIAGGIAWNIACVFLAWLLSRKLKYSPPSSFWLQQAGWIGFAISIIAAFAYYFMSS
ncbi:hypothetical protein [uncultured Gimesia sp.]|uniref:hypothetical protein n=1 Tax=uncultured Gimesia sp. TaxID=1678688 RepID=UPI0030DB9721|tara:strand:+ start:1180 stop:1380 length:201 start_codon:yes stop_codon:yes gene_type:complete